MCERPSTDAQAAHDARAIILWYSNTMFVDRAEIFIKSGRGGDGAVTFRREPYVPEGGPDGGDGGRGGDVVFVADRNLRTLMDFRYKRKYEAERGQNGMRKKMYGKAGSDLEIRVPTGTMVIDKETGALMKDLVEDGDRLVAAKGGKGGKGNVHFKSSVRQAPNFAEAGGEARERTVILELKLIADVGLVGFPNVGKSTLLAASSKAKPKIADYHFTTIQPNLGVVEIGEDSFVMADIAGIIEGASQGAGMGFLFLKHIERTKVLIHVVDVSGSEGRDPVEDFEKIQKELAAYSPALLKKPQLIAASKIDLLSDETKERYEAFRTHVAAQGYEVFPISAPIGEGTEALLKAALHALSLAAEEPEEEPEVFDFEKEDRDPDYRKVSAHREGDVYVLEGKQLLKIFRSTNFHDMGSLRYLYKYIEKSGILEDLRAWGLEEGDTIRIEDFEFEYFDEF